MDNRPEVARYLVQSAGVAVDSQLKLATGEKVTALHLAVLEGAEKKKEKAHRTVKKVLPSGSIYLRLGWGSGWTWDWGRKGKKTSYPKNPVSGSNKKLGETNKQ